MIRLGKERGNACKWRRCSRQRDLAFGHVLVFGRNATYEWAWNPVEVVVDAVRELLRDGQSLSLLALFREGCSYATGDFP